MKVTIRSINMENQTLYGENGIYDELVLKHNIEALIIFDGITIDGKFSFDAGLFENPTLKDYENAIKNLFREQ